MTTQAQRVVRLVIGVPGTEGREITRNRIVFKTPKTKSKFPNKCKIEIYNLDPTTAAFIESDEARNSVQLFAGYTGTFGQRPDNVTDNGTAPGLIFSGEIRRGKARTVLNPPNRVTTIQASDGGAGYRSGRINKSFGAGVTAFDLINELGKTWNVGIPVPDDITDIPLEQGFVASGRTADVMDSLAVTLGFNWWWEDGEVVIVSNDGDTGEEAYLLSTATGLIGSPQKTDKGLNVKCLLNPALRVKRLVQIDANDVKGFYRIQKLEHEGDSWGERPFITSLECKAVTAGKSPTKKAKEDNLVSKIRAQVIGAALMRSSLSAAVALAANPAFGNVFIAEFSASEYGLVSYSESVKLQSQLAIFEKDGGLIFV